MQNQKETEPEQTGQDKKPKSKQKKRKKEGKIQQVWEMSQKGLSVADIAKKTGLTERVVRSYIWRAKNPEKFKALLARYQEKRKKKLAESAKEPSNEDKK